MSDPGIMVDIYSSAAQTTTEYTPPGPGEILLSKILTVHAHLPKYSSGLVRLNVLTLSFKQSFS